MLQLRTQISEAADFVRRQWTNVRPAVGIILGSGLGEFAAQIEIEAEIPYATIPHFGISTAIGHRGELVCGRLGPTAVVAMQGRFHRYEGYSLAQVALPVRVMKDLGIQVLIVSNASGGLNPSLRPGDIMVIDDHINWMFDNPLFGINDDTLGPRFPDMSQPYDGQLIELAMAIGRRANMQVHRGVYGAVTGPTYETRAESRFLRQLGADVVGMSTVPEVLVAVHAGLRVLAFSVVTNVCRPDVPQRTAAEEVIAAARNVEPRMRVLVLGVLAQLWPHGVPS
jgi:purine-nucleoside phosphorylase